MGKKASAKSSTPALISLSEAVALLERHWPRHLAIQKLASALPTIRKEYDFEGQDPGPDAIWKLLSGQGGPQNFVSPHWEGNCIEYWNRGRCTLYNIRVAREHVEKLLPEAARQALAGGARHGEGQGAKPRRG